MRWNCCKISAQNTDCTIDRGDAHLNTAAAVTDEVVIRGVVRRIAVRVQNVCPQLFQRRKYIAGDAAGISGVITADQNITGHTDVAEILPREDLHRFFAVFAEIELRFADTVIFADEAAGERVDAVELLQNIRSKY